jgi:hypothetical protein
MITSGTRAPASDAHKTPQFWLIWAGASASTSSAGIGVHRHGLADAAGDLRRQA